MPIESVLYKTAGGLPCSAVLPFFRLPIFNFDDINNKSEPVFDWIKVRIILICLKEQHLIQVGGNKIAARTQHEVFNAAIFLPSINILYLCTLKIHTPNL